MRRKLLIFLPILFSFAVSGCGANPEPSNPGHTHDFSSTWTYDNNYHWHACNGCDETKDKAAHSLGDLIVDTPATATESGSGHYECNVCDYVKTVNIDPTGHTHHYSDIWSFDETNHWKECICGDKIQESSHTLSNYYVIDLAPSGDEPGLRHKECTVCDYETEPEEFYEAIEASNIYFTETSRSVGVGENITITAHLYPDNATYPEIEWRSTNTDIATVDRGVVYGKAIGNCQVEASINTSNGVFSAFINIQVVDAQENETVQYQIYSQNDDGTGYRLVGLKGQTDEIVIPVTHNGIPVIGINSRLFDYSYDETYTTNYAESLKKITAPSSLEYVQEDAFRKMPSLAEIDYDGTKAEWLSIQEGWCADNVVCTDGVLSDNLTGPEITTDYTEIEVGNFVFKSGGSYDYSVQLVRLLGTETNVHVPATYNRRPVELNLHDEQNITANEAVRNLYVNSFSTVNTLSHFSNIESLLIGYNFRYLNTVQPNSDYELMGTMLDVLPSIGYDTETWEEIRYEGSAAEHIQVDVLNQVLKAIDDVVYSKDEHYVIFAANKLSGTVTLSENVKEITPEAFLYCKDISTVVLSNGLLKIDDEAFSSSGISSITLPNTLLTIGKSAFSQCERLTAIEIPNSVTNIKEDAFNECHRLKTAVLPDNLKIIEGGTFNSCTILSSVTFPSKLEEIGNNAFKDCSFLKDLQLPDGLKFIGNEAFAGCYCLGDVHIPSSVVAIGNNAFAGVNSFNITSSLVELGYQTANNFTFDSTSERFVYEDGALYNSSKTRLISYNSNGEDAFFEIPESTHVIDSYAFTGFHYNYIEEFSYSITINGEHLSADIAAFFESEGVDYEESDRYYVPNKNNAFLSFYNDSTWEGVDCTVVEFNLDINYFYNVENLDNYLAFINGAFAHEGLSVTEIPQVTSASTEDVSIGFAPIYEQVFSKLEVVVIPTTVTYILENAFYDCVDYPYIFYKGTEEQFANINLQYTEDGYPPLELSRVRYYSESYSSNGWHYANNVPTAW